MIKIPTPITLTVDATDIEFTYDDFELVGYDPYPLIKGKVSV